jgi:hypothetical protein
MLTDFVSCGDIWGMNTVLMSERAFEMLRRSELCDYETQGILLNHNERTYEYLIVVFSPTINGVPIKKYIDITKSEFYVTNFLGMKDYQIHAKSFLDIDNEINILRKNKDYSRTVFATHLHFKTDLYKYDILLMDYYDFGLYISKELFLEISSHGFTGLEIVETNKISFGSISQ